MAAPATMLMLILRPIKRRWSEVLSVAIISSLSEENKPKHTGKKQRKAGINQNLPDNLLVQSKADQQPICHNCQDHTHKQADQPRGKERTHDVECGCLPAAI